MKVIQGILAMDEGKAMLKQVGDQTDVDRERLKRTSTKKKFNFRIMDIIINIAFAIFNIYIITTTTIITIIHDQADQRNLTALGHAVTWGQVRWLTIQIITMPGEANNDCDGDADDDGDQDDDNDKGARGCLFGGCWSISE